LIFNRVQARDASAGTIAEITQWRIDPSGHLGDISSSW